MNKILVVEDELAIAELIHIALTQEGYQVEYALDGEKGADCMEKGQYDLILLDIMLPGYDGYELLEFAKALEIPVIFITAKGQLKDRIKGLNLGADDYIVKPFEIEELAARVKSVLRRCSSIVTIGGLEIDRGRRRILREKQEIRLTPKEYELFIFLYEHQGRVLRRELIFENVWQEEMENETRTLDLHIQRIRKKLGLKEEIRTIHKVGYLFEV
ncbi:MAG: response regulator transcription factor [Lachnospiraceae bacterium]|nr:response regulator transcription factor [Lachnospiraceae bacterium]